jgi:hypothetical protein
MLPLFEEVIAFQITPLLSLPVLSNKPSSILCLAVLNGFFIHQEKNLLCFMTQWHGNFQEIF